jgi:hygromycin-B 4-O-kinase
MKPLDPSTVIAFLAAHLGGQIEGAEELTGGDWSRAFGFRHEGRDLVVRFGDFPDDFEKDRVAARLLSGRLPVPKVLELGTAFDAHFCISERAFGTMLDQLDAPSMHRVIPAVLDLLDGLRETDVAPWTEKFGASNSTWAEQLLSVDGENDRVFGWHDNLKRSLSGIEPFEKGLRYLHQHIHICPERSNLLHTDLLHMNVLVADDRIVAVIDWGCASLGDFLYELAMFTFYSHRFPAMDRIDWLSRARAHFESIGLIVPNLLERLRLYEIHIGLTNLAYNAFREDWDEVAAHSELILNRL